MKQLYTLFGWLLYLLVLPAVHLYSLLTGNRLDELRQRLGRCGDELAALPDLPRIWLHAASVGEVRAAVVLVEALRTEQVPAAYVLTTMTKSGNRLARALLADRAAILYAPFDAAPAARRAAAAIRPALYIGLETEIWPVLLARLGAEGVSCILANARMSERSWRRYRRIRKFIGDTLSVFREIAAITEEDAARFTDLGIDRSRITVCGSVKYDGGAGDGHAVATLAARLSLPAAARVFVCGSTREGEEELLLPCMHRLFAAIDGLVWILAPRHLDRLHEVESLLRTNGIAWQRFSELGGNDRRSATVLVDTMGDLADLYGVATWAFCGGSLVDRGGHNIVEPVRHGIPVFHGPYMADFREAQRLLAESGAGFTVASGEELAERILAFHRQPSAYDQARRQAAAFAGSRHGALDCQKRIILRAFAAAGGH